MEEENIDALIELLVQRCLAYREEAGEEHERSYDKRKPDITSTPLNQPWDGLEARLVSQAVVAHTYAIKGMKRSNDLSAQVESKELIRATSACSPPRLKHTIYPLLCSEYHRYHVGHG